MQGRLARFISDRVRILAAMSHDLKTPITRMRLRTEMLEDAAVRTKFERDLGEMETMVTQALEFMRDSSAEEPVRQVDIMALLETLQSDYRDAGKRVEIAGRVAQPYGGRPLALRRCLTNLVENALRYGQEAAIEVEDGAQEIAVRIRDRGPGIPEGELERVFEPFYRGEASRSRETGGSGLGLGIARNIARAHGGDIVLRNRPGGGLEALLTLPRTEQRGG
jgi:signal transduction histidine kinase